MVDKTPGPGWVPPRRGKQTKVARELKYHTNGDDDGYAGDREPRQPIPVVGPQQAVNPGEDIAAAGNSCNSS